MLKQAGNGQSRRYIQGSKSSERFQNCKRGSLWRFKQKFEKSHSAEKIEVKNTKIAKGGSLVCFRGSGGCFFCLERGSECFKPP